MSFRSRDVAVSSVFVVHTTLPLYPFCCNNNNRKQQGDFRCRCVCVCVNDIYSNQKFGATLEYTTYTTRFDIFKIDSTVVFTRHQSGCGLQDRTGINASVPIRQAIIRVTRYRYSDSEIKKRIFVLPSSNHNQRRGNLCISSFHTSNYGDIFFFGMIDSRYLYDNKQCFS